MSHWYVVLTEPQQELPCVWRVHLLGLELFTPVLRRRVKTGRVHHGHAITRIMARPMFPSYGFIRQTGRRDLDGILAMRGVRGFLRNERGALVMLPDEAVLAVFAKQQEIHGEFLAGPAQHHQFKPGDLIRVTDAGSYSGLVAPVDRIPSRDRIQVLFGMIRHSLPAEMVEAVA